MIDVEEFRNVPNMVDVAMAALDAPSGLKLEFGVFTGSSIRQIATTLPEETIWGFDSFTGTDDMWDKGRAPIAMSKFDLRGKTPTVPDNVKLVKGLFQDTLPDWWAEHRAPIGFLNIDSDLYESAIFVLRVLDTGIVPGTLVRFDELCDFCKVFGETPKPSYRKWEEGEWRALNEWLDSFLRRVVPIGRMKQSGVVRVVE